MASAVTRDPASTAWAAVARQLRTEIAQRRYGPGVALPTEVELAQRHGVSRQTVRRAFVDLVAQGLVYRVPGRGTFATEGGGPYIRSTGSIDDLMALSLDTDLEILTPPQFGVDIEAAGRLHLERDTVVTMVFRRLHQGAPYCVTTAWFPPEVGQALVDVAELATPGLRPHTTVIGLMQRATGRTIAAADQTITATAASPEVAEALGTEAGTPVLRIDRLYRDRDGDVLELAVNHFHPARYTYRFQLRADRV
jgi:DNA-binding GntR family transcriptional regulator